MNCIVFCIHILNFFADVPSYLPCTCCAFLFSPPSPLPCCPLWVVLWPFCRIPSGTLPSATLFGSLWLKAWAILLVASSLTSLECSLQDIMEKGGVACPSMATIVSYSLLLLWLTYSPLASLVAILKSSVILSPNP